LLFLSRLPALADVTAGRKGMSDRQRLAFHNSGAGIWPQVHGYTVSDAAELLKLGRLVGTCHAKLTKPNQNFTHGVSISAPGLMCQREGSFDSQPRS